MKIKATEQKEFEIIRIEEDLYHAEFKDIRDVSPGEYGDRVALLFSVYHDPEKEPVELAHICNKKLNPESNLGKAILPLGAEVVADQDVDFDTLKGKACRVMVEDYKKEDKVQSTIKSVKAAAEGTAAFIEGVKKKVGTSTEKEKVDVDEVK